MFSNFKSLFDGLALEQIVSLFNVLAYIILIINFTSILILIQGDKIINKFKLEIKFLKLSKWIKLRQNLADGYLIFNIILFYITLLLFLFANLYMLLLKYFIYEFIPLLSF